MRKKNNFVLIAFLAALFLTACSSNTSSQNSKAAKKTGVTKSVIRANVDDNGKVTLIGSWPKNAKNPICEVNYEDNRQLDFNKHGVYATNVVKALQKHYGIKKINMVGHSLGNIQLSTTCFKMVKTRRCHNFKKKLILLVTLLD